MPNHSSHHSQAGIHITLQELLQLRHFAPKLRLRQTKRSSSIHTGDFQSRQQGRGIDFDENRNYQPGDDIRTMDWRVTARTGTPHIKLYHQERERPVYFLVDFTQSMFFGTRVAFKSVIAAKAAALLAWMFSQHGDRVGGIVFSDAQRTEIKPKARDHGLLPLFKQFVSYAQTQSLIEDPDPLANALKQMDRLRRPGSTIVIVSDFQRFSEESKRSLTHLKQRSQCICLQILDPLEEHAPPPARYAISNGSELQTIDTRDPHFSKKYEAYFAERQKTFIQFLKQHHISYSQLRTNDPLVKTLDSFGGFS